MACKEIEDLNCYEHLNNSEILKFLKSYFCNEAENEKESGWWSEFRIGKKTMNIWINMKCILLNQNATNEELF